MPRKKRSPKTGSPKVPPNITNMSTESEVKMLVRTSVQPQPTTTTNQPSPKGKDKSSPQAQLTNTPTKPNPSTPARYAPLLRVLHHALLAIATIPNLQMAHDPTLAYLSILSRQNLSDLITLLAEDNQTDWLAQNAKRTQVLIVFIGLEREKCFGTFGSGHALQTAEAELDNWFNEMDSAVEGDWDPERKGQELSEIVGKIRALDKAGNGDDHIKPGVQGRRAENENETPLPAEPQTWECKQRAMAASKRLQEMMFDGGPVTPMKGKIEFGPPIRKTL